jgi:hypothetical protein
MNRSECPSHEDLAAFMDDGLTFLERSDMTFHLTTCERCFSLYIDTMRYLLESENALEKGVDLCERQSNIR